VRLRSAWRWVCLGASVAFAFVAIAMLVDSRDPGSIVIAVAVACFAGFGGWTALRAGVEVSPDAVAMRSFLSLPRTVPAGQVAAVSVEDDQHGWTALAVVVPELVLTDGSRVRLLPLARYGLLGGRDRVMSDAAQLAAALGGD